MLLCLDLLLQEDEPAEPGLWILHLSSGGAKWEKAEEVVGLGVYETARRLVEKYGDKVAIALIGPGGEIAAEPHGDRRDLPPSQSLRRERSTGAWQFASGEAALWRPFFSRV